MYKNVAELVLLAEVYIHTSQFRDALRQRCWLAGVSELLKASIDTLCSLRHNAVHKLLASWDVLDEAYHL